MRGSSCWGSWSSWPWCSGFPSSSGGWGVDDISYVLTLLVLVPLVGSVAVWVAGITQRAAKWIALGFSLVETGLTTLLLVGFVEPAWAFAFGAPTFTRPPTAGLFVPLYYMGWAQPTVRGAEVPDLHARRVRHHAPLDFRVVLQQRGREHGCLRGECEHARHDRVLGRCAAARDGGARVLDARAPDSDFRGVLDRVFGKASVVPVPHMAPGRPCRSADRRLRHPGGRNAEDGRLRNLPDQLRHAAGCRAGPVVGPRDPRVDLNGLRRVRVPRPSRPEAAHRLQLDRPHGGRPPRSIEPHGDRSPRRDLPAVQPRDHHGDPLHARGFRETCDGHPGHPGTARPRQGDAAVLLRPRDWILRVARASGPQLVLVRVHGLRRHVRIAESRHDAAVG